VTCCQGEIRKNLSDLCGVNFNGGLNMMYWTHRWNGGIRLQQVVQRISLICQMTDHLVMRNINEGDTPFPRDPWYEIMRGSGLYQRVALLLPNILSWSFEAWACCSPPFLPSPSCDIAVCARSSVKSRCDTQNCQKTMRVQVSTGDKNLCFESSDLWWLRQLLLVHDRHQR
jgi:hypothetical protein